MMQYEHVLFETDTAGIALVTINRPDKLNALSAAVIAELRDIFERIGKDPAIRAAILTGAGEKAFVAGADIRNWRRFAGGNARVGAARAADVSFARNIVETERGGHQRLRARRRTGTGDGLHRAVRVGKRHAWDSRK
jgi:enoyl-CoA hydratase/carnithine racemase